MEWNRTGPLVNSTISDLYPVPVGIIALLAILYGSISVAAIIGNSLVISVIIINKKMQTVTNIFIANLAFADVILGMFTIPFQFQAALLQRWVVADFMCWVAPFVKDLSVNISIFTLTCIAIDRYIAVLYPLKAGFKKSVAAVILVFIWVFGTVSSIPQALYMKVTQVPENATGKTKPFCRPFFPHKDFGRYYFVYLLCIQYILPLIIINFSYIRIAYRIWGTKAPGDYINRRDDIRARNRKKVVKILIIVVCLFVICWLPLQIYNVVSQVYREVNDYKYINIIWFCSNWFAMSNSCYNPFIYGLLNDKFKRAFRRIFWKCCRKLYKDHDFPDFSDDLTIRTSFIHNGKYRTSVNGSMYSRHHRRSTKLSIENVDPAMV
ncbi:neuromedin-K receptor-like [Mytilus californianus]|uniref:neuromedin-K receptor-like n=1 Tax=Mytilus californianus TaxID=6549 RepID=UPI0022478945|nr:neuromedin-K receptor-like [Mytilus californianus]